MTGNGVAHVEVSIMYKKKAPRTQLVRGGGIG